MTDTLDYAVDSSSGRRYTVTTDSVVLVSAGSDVQPFIGLVKKVRARTFACLFELLRSFYQREGLV